MSLPTLFTVAQPPAGFRVDHLFDMIQLTRSVKLGRQAEEPAAVQEALDQFAGSAPEAANAVIGVSHSTCVSTAADGSLTLYLTYIGTPAVLTEMVPTPGK